MEDLLAVGLVSVALYPSTLFYFLSLSLFSTLDTHYHHHHYSNIPSLYPPQGGEENIERNECECIFIITMRGIHNNQKTSDTLEMDGSFLAVQTIIIIIMKWFGGRFVLRF